MSQSVPYLQRQAPRNIRQDTNNPESALRVCIAEIKDDHVGKKVRIYGRCIDYTVKQALLYLRDDLFPILSQTEDDTPEDSTPQYSITVDCTTVVVGDRYDQQVEGDDMSGFAAGERRRQAALRFLPGEGFEVVGWVEKLEQKMKGTASHLGPSVCPPLYILSAIHISPCETYLPHDSSRRRPL